jgi:hypothetical protein
LHSSDESEIGRWFRGGGVILPVFYASLGGVPQVRVTTGT